MVEVTGRDQQTS